MGRFSRSVAFALCALLALVYVPGVVEAQRRAEPRHPTHPQRAIAVRGHVFIGGYFYDPSFGPYPWWRRPAYPYWYFPMYDSRAEVRLQVEPKEAERAAVYVDGFYAGIVDDFNGVFQGLPLTPGGHALVLYLEGYRTVEHNLYLRAGSTFRLRQTMERLPAGESSRPPDRAPAVPPPPAGSYRTPVTPPGAALPEPAPPASAVGFGTLDLYVQPSNAEVTIDGRRWASSEEGHFMVQVPAGSHRIEVQRPGYRPFATDLDVPDDQTIALNVSLTTTP